MNNKLLGIILSVVLILSSFGVVSADSNTPGYVIRAVADSSSVTASIDIENASATVGTFAFAFDAEKVTLLSKDGSALSGTDVKAEDVVDNDDCITVPKQNDTNGHGVSLTEGYVMFTWYATGTRVEALDEPQTIATLHFELKDGVTVDDFNSTTFRMRTIAPGDYIGWESGACIATGAYDYFWNNADGYPQCSVTKSYPNSDVHPIYLYPAELTVTDAEGAPVDGANVRIDETDYTSDSAGKAVAELPNGMHSYTVSKDGYESKSGIINVLDSGVNESVIIRSDLQFITEEIGKISITFVDGEDANSVRSSIGLMLWDTENEKLTWTSSNTNVITNAGAVIPPAEDTKVTLTATLTKGQASVTRTYDLTVLKKSSQQSPSNGSASEEYYPEEDEFDSIDGSNSNNKPENENSNTETNISAPQNPNTTAPTVSTAPAFNDLEAYSWAQEAIISLAREGIIKGTSATTFEPGANIKRGDFVTLLVRMFEFDAQPADNFEDVPKDSYYYNEIAIAKALGLAKGVDENNFEPESSITRQDMMVIALRAINQRGLPVRELSPDVFDTYIDKNEIAPYAYESIQSLVGAGLITGNDVGEIQPYGITTRAEVAVFLYRIYHIT